VSFSGQIAAFNRKVTQRYRTVAKTAVQETVSMAQRVRDEGGRMRVDTGFLRASIQAAVGNMPSGPTENENKKKYPIGSIVAGEPVSVTLVRWNPDREEVLYIGWTANYARYREAQDGFLRGAVELWDVTVNSAVAKVRAGFGQ